MKSIKVDKVTIAERKLSGLCIECGEPRIKRGREWGNMADSKLLCRHHYSKGTIIKDKYELFNGYNR